jgi:hypothetical membrane protein
VELTLKKLRFCGTIGLIIYWSFVFYAIKNNSWFDYYRHALSALGAFGATFSAIYNYGVVLTGIMFFFFSIYLIYISKNKIQTVGGAFVSIAALFIIFIGLFPAGTKQHDFVAVYFFFQFFLGMAVFGIGASNKVITPLFVLIFVLAFALSPLKWPSLAILETYELSLILVETTVMIFFNPQPNFL